MTQRRKAIFAQAAYDAHVADRCAAVPAAVLLVLAILVLMAGGRPLRADPSSAEDMPRATSVQPATRLSMAPHISFPQSRPRLPRVDVQAAVGARCVRHEPGSIECRPGDGATYVWRVTPDMAGQTVDIASLTSGVTITPALQAITQDQRVLEFRIHGAAGGRTVRLMKKLVAQPADQSSTEELCCLEEFEVELPKAGACAMPVSATAPLAPRVTQQRPSTPPRVTIEKQCASCALGGACECRVTLRNLGIAPLTTPIGFRDPAGAGAGGVARFRTDGSDWRCAGPPGALTCELPPASLPPLSARMVTVVYPAQPLQSGAGNRTNSCAVLQADEAVLRAAKQREACAEFGSDIVITVTGDNKCRFATQCAFEATITNRSAGAYLGSLSYLGELSIGDDQGARADIVAIEPRLACADAPVSLPFACAGRMQLPGRETRKLRITFRLPSAPGGGSGDSSGRVCLAVAEGDAGSTASARAGIVQLVRQSQPEPQWGRQASSGIACVQFAALARCPGNLKLRGDRCACPDDQERYNGDLCRPVSTSPPPATPPLVRPLPPVVQEPPIVRPPPIVVPPIPRCNEPYTVRDSRGLCVCEDGYRRADGRSGACIPIARPTTPAACNGPYMVRRGNACECQTGYRMIGGSSPSCVPDRVTCNPPSVLIQGTCVPPKDCYGRQIPANQTCAQPTKDCYGRQIPANQRCTPLRPTTKLCNGQQIPIALPCRPPRPATKFCNGQRIPADQACRKPSGPIVR